MKNLFCFTVMCFGVLQGFGQSKAGITGVPDTSYTTYSAFMSSRKSHPEIKIVQRFHLKSVKEKRNIPYCSIGKRKLLLDVFNPSTKAKTPRPAIMIIHGGGWRSGNRTQHYPLAQKLADLGYVCFTPEYRLSTEALYPAAVYDLKSALRWMHHYASKFNVDTNKIAVLGFSAGGELAAFLATTMGMEKFEGNECNEGFSSNVQALVDLDGTLSFVHRESGEGDDSKKTSAATYWFGFSKKEKPELWKEASPLTYVSASTPPTLFINSGVERMHAGRTDYLEVLNKNSIYSEVKSFPSAPHSFPLFEPWFAPTVQYTDAFLKKVFGLK